MLKSLELLFAVVVTGVSLVLAVVFLWFVLGMMVSFWKVYVVKSGCDHNNKIYTAKHDGTILSCKDCGKVIKK